MLAAPSPSFRSSVPSRIVSDRARCVYTGRLERIPFEDHYAHCRAARAAERCVHALHHVQDVVAGMRRLQYFRGDARGGGSCRAVPEPVDDGEQLALPVGDRHHPIPARFFSLARSGSKSNFRHGLHSREPEVAGRMRGRGGMAGSLPDSRA
jgi:hypothetical protein